MKTMVFTGMILCACAFSAASGFAASRYYYDVQKIDAVMKDPKVEAQFTHHGSLDGIELASNDGPTRTIHYRLRSGSCTLSVELGYDDGWEPNYHVTSVGEFSCN